jgi:hypothetical protein
VKRERRKERRAKERETKPGKMKEMGEIRGKRRIVGTDRD